MIATVIINSIIENPANFAERGEARRMAGSIGTWPSYVGVARGAMHPRLVVRGREWTVAARTIRSHRAGGAGDHVLREDVMDKST